MLSDLQRISLAMLNEEDLTGYFIAARLKDSTMHQHQQVYRELASMEKKGYVSSLIQHQSDKPDKKIYSITSDGYQELIKSNNSDIKSDLFGRGHLVTLILSSTSPADLVPMLKKYITAQEKNYVLLDTDGKLYLELRKALMKTQIDVLKSFTKSCKD